MNIRRYITDGLNIYRVTLMVLTAYHGGGCIQDLKPTSARPTRKRDGNQRWSIGI